MALFHVAIAGSIHIGTTVASRLLLFLFGENDGLCVVVLAVPGWCWQQVGSRPQAEFGSHDQVVKISAEIVGEHLQPNVSLFLGKRLGLKNDAAQSRQSTVRLLGRSTLAGVTIPARDPLSTAPHEVASPNE